jgi:hypothetical protein
LGAVIIQDEKPIAFYIRKLNSAQQRYKTGEEELLPIVETLHVNPSGKAGTQIPQLPMGTNSSPWGDNAV